ncbi:hypothetical protein SLEP1_g14956 [Rubroshorea leprosula]|uniref:Uncharacterized protein n=1 Tax=Rubroshorea leprosula TaxID=152421 RepID=A0AAV5ITP0_9ROSI|nr:hypothetical protein SLEP1_g14956 [Rubroshorea leprosula]
MSLYGDLWPRKESAKGQIYFHTRIALNVFSELPSVS